MNQIFQMTLYRLMSKEKKRTYVSGLVDQHTFLLKQQRRKIQSQKNQVHQKAIQNAGYESTPHLRQLAAQELSLQGMLNMVDRFIDRCNRFKLQADYTFEMNRSLQSLTYLGNFARMLPAMVKSASVQKLQVGLEALGQGSMALEGVDAELKDLLDGIYPSGNESVDDNAQINELVQQYKTLAQPEGSVLKADTVNDAQEQREQQLMQRIRQLDEGAV